MSDLPQKSQFLIYQAESGAIKLDVRFENETVWLTQKHMAELFQVTPQNITLHLKAIFSEGELSEAATCKEYLQVRTEGILRAGLSDTIAGQPLHTLEHISASILAIEKAAAGLLDGFLNGAR